MNSGSEVRHKIFLVRHGQSAGNVCGKALSPDDDILTDFGRMQAKALGHQLRDIVFHKAYASTYQRARETGKEILRQNMHPTPGLVEDCRLRERDLGPVIEGADNKHLVGLIIKGLMEGKKLNQIEIPGGETLLEFEKRQQIFFQDLFSSMSSCEKSQNVLVVSHGLTINSFLSGLNESSCEKLWNVVNWQKKCCAVVQNTACTTFTVHTHQNNNGGAEFEICIENVHSKTHLTGLESESDGDIETALKSVLLGAMGENAKALMEQLKATPGVKEEISNCMQM